MITKRALKVTVLSATVTVSALWGTAVSAQENPDYTAPAPSVAATLPAQQARSSGVSGGASAAAASSQLPVTGSDAAQLAAIGGVMVAGGAAVLAARRRATA